MFDSISKPVGTGPGGALKAIAGSSELQIRLGDSRELGWLKPESLHLVLTSPPYWTLKQYPGNPRQLGHIEDYDRFHDQLDKVWRHCFRALVPGGRLVCVVGDVCLSRRRHGRHSVMPLHADITVRACRIGFDSLAPIFWRKIANATYEAGSGRGFFGKPYEPNAILKNDVEFILMLRKPGGYRHPSQTQRDASRLSKEEHHEWFRQVLDLHGESTRYHPAPFPEALAYRLVRMFSFAGDTILDPFMGTGTTLVASARCGRDAIGVEVEPAYARMARERIEKDLGAVFCSAYPADRLEAEAVAGAMGVGMAEAAMGAVAEANSGFAA